MPAPVLLEKVRRREATGLLRHRLVDRLVGPASPGLGLVVAAAGSGKTTLLAQAAEHAGGPAAWYCAGPEDGTEDALVRHLAHALVTAGMPVAGGIGHLDELIDAVQAARPTRLLLVVDDVHALAETRAEAALERLLWLRPRAVRVVLGSRRPPSMNTPRLQASGDLVELGGDDLRFRSWEVEDLFRRVHGEPLSPESAAALTRRTGGWAAALQLFHLSVAGRAQHDRERAVTELSGRSRLLRSYLARNLLAELSEERRGFLLRTCTLGVLTGAMCDELLDRSGSGAVLADLERRQFFTTSGDERRSFRYHQVLRSHLEVLLVDEIGQQGAQQWYARAGRVLEGAGYAQEALHAYARSEDWGAVARLIRRGRTQLADLGDAPNDPGPVSPGDDPWLRLAQARRLFRRGSVRQAVAAFREAEALGDDPEFRTRCAAERSVAGIWLPLSEGDVARYPARATAPQLARYSASLVRAATIRAVDAGQFDSAPALAAGLAHLLAGRLAPAAAALEQAAAGAATSGEHDLAVLAAIAADLVGGGTRDWSTVLEELVLSAEVGGDAWVGRLARAIEAATLALASDEAWWSESLAELERTCRSEEDAWGALLIALASGTVQVRRGRDELALEAFRRAGEAAAGLGAPVLGVWAEVAGLPAVARLRPSDLRRSRDTARRHAHALGLEIAPALAVVLQPADASGAGTEFPRARGSGPARQPAAGASPVELACLGGFRLRRGSTPVDVSALRPRPRDLLLLLALHHGHDLHREVIIDALWPEAPVEAGAHRLHVAVSSLRRLLAAHGFGERSVQRHGDAYALELGCGSSDVQSFQDRIREGTRLRSRGEALLAHQAWVKALETYAGELLPEAGPAEWVLADRERLRLAAAAAAVEAARGAGRLNRLDDAVTLAQRAVALDPLRDSAWALLAELQVAAGDRSASAATRRRHLAVASSLAGPAPDVRDQTPGISPARPPGRGGSRGRA